MPNALSGLARVLASFVGLSSEPPPLPARILVALFMPIGDVLLAQPAVAGIRRTYPKAHITVLVARPRRELVRTMPEFDEVLMYDDAPEREAVGRLDATLRMLTPRRFDLLISMSTAGNALGMLSGIPRQQWQALPLGCWLWGSALDPAYRAKHAVRLYWDVVAPLGIRPQRPEDWVPSWYVPDGERQQAQEALRRIGVEHDPTRPLLLLHPGAAGYGGRKRWPAARFGELAQDLLKDGAQVIVLGGTVDRAAAGQIVAATQGRAHSFAGKMPLRASIALITQADGYIGCDSGLTHYAVALGIRTVGIFGFSNVQTFAPTPADPARLRLVLPDPLPPPQGFFIGNNSVFFPPRRRPDDRMATITCAQVAVAIKDLDIFPR